MTKLLTILLASIAMGNLAWAQPTSHPTEFNSLSKAAIERAALGAPPSVIQKEVVAYANSDEQYNSLSRAALAKQGTKTVYLRFDSGTPIFYRKPIPAQMISPSTYSFWHRTH